MFPSTKNTDWQLYAATLIERLKKNPELKLFEGKYPGPLRGGRQKDEARSPSFIAALNAIEERAFAPLHVDGEVHSDADDLFVDEEAPNNHALPSRALSLAIRLAQTFGDDASFDRKCLGQAKLAVLTCTDPIDIDSLYRLIAVTLVPSNCPVTIEPSHFTGFSSELILLFPKNEDGKISDFNFRQFTSNIFAALEQQTPCLIILPTTLTLPGDLLELLPAPIAVSPLSREGMAIHLRESHGVQKDDMSEVEAQLPDDKEMASLPFRSIAVALRNPTASGVAAALKSRAEPRKSKSPTLEEFSGSSPALMAARSMVADLMLWRDGKCSWEDMTRSVLLYGPPGTGKSHLARAMGNSAGVSFIQSSLAEWQSAGHLGQFLAAMQQTFAEARSRSPAVLFIDEVDSAGSRFDPDDHGRNYRRQVINGVLEQIDLIIRHEGVLLVGACNDPSTLDPAILRAGRFDLKLEVPRPGIPELIGMLKRALPDAACEDHLEPLARQAVGLTAAEVDAAIRQARSTARGAGRTFTLNDVKATLNVSTKTFPALDRRVALHEVGHAIVAVALRLGEVSRIAITPQGGETYKVVQKNEGLLSDIQAEMTFLLAGRAAEQLMLADVSAGSGGPSGSDLAIATNLALKVDTSTGLGASGPVWRGDTATLMLHDNYQMQRVRRRLEDAQMTAEKILERNRSLLEDMAKVLVSKRELSGPQLEDLLGRVEPERGEGTMLRGQHELYNGRLITKSDGLGDCDGFRSITR